MPPKEAREDDPLLPKDAAGTAAGAAEDLTAGAGAAFSAGADTGRAAQRHARAAQMQADEKFNKMVDKLGIEPYMNRVIDKRQFDDYPKTTLFVARLCKGCLVFFVVLCCIGLITGFLFQGSLELLEEVNQVDSFNAPKLALCAQPWGERFKAEPKLNRVDFVSIPSGEISELPPANYTSIKCPREASGCHCVDMTSVLLKPRKGSRAGEYQTWQYLRVDFEAANSDPNESQYAFGFYSEDVLPQQWTYSNLGSISEGDITAEEVAHGKTEFTDGEPCPRFSFRFTGQSPSKDGRSVLMFGYDVFLLYVIASVGSKWSVFSLLTLLITFCAAVNNFGLFEIIFPEKLDDEDPAQLEPNPVLATVCGMCCIFCKTKAELEGKDDPELEGKAVDSQA